MIILDTNVLSALMRANLEPVVTAWLNLQSLELRVASVALCAATTPLTLPGTR